MTFTFPRRAAVIAALSLLALPARAAHSTVELVSRAHPSLISDSAFGAGGGQVSVSADGRFVAFTSPSPLLVEGFVDANLFYYTDVFLFDRQSGTTVLVSHSVASPLQTSNGDSESPVVSGDGRYVAFVSSGGDLVPGQVDGGSWYDVFLYDRLDGSVRLVSHKSASPVTTAGAEEYGGLAVSHSGDRVAWVSRSTEVVAGRLDVPNSSDVFLFETATGSNLLVSHSDTLPPTAGYLDSASPSMSADGRRIAFVTESTNLVQGLLDLNSAQDVFLFDLDTSLVTPVSRTAGVLYATADGESSWAEVSGDGGHVAFVSQATDLVAGQVDPNFDRDVFLADLAGDARALVSHAAGQPLVAGNHGGGDRREVVLSSDGSTVAFTSFSSDLVAPASNGRDAVYAWRSSTGGCVLASHDPDGQAIYVNELTGISADGPRTWWPGLRTRTTTPTSSRGTGPRRCSRRGAHLRGTPSRPRRAPPRARAALPATGARCSSSAAPPPWFPAACPTTTRPMPFSSTAPRGSPDSSATARPGRGPASAPGERRCLPTAAAWPSRARPATSCPGRSIPTTTRTSSSTTA